MNWSLTLSLFLSFLIPLFLASVAGLISSKAGVINIALEGMMVMGGLGYVIADEYFNAGPLTWLYGILMGILFAGILGLAHAILCVHFRGNQIISGTGLNFFAQGFGLVCVYALLQNTTIFIHNPITQIKYDSTGNGIDLTFFIFIGLILFLYVGYYHTKVGLRWRACGDQPYAVHSVGISVYKYRFIAVCLSAAMAGIAGACYIGHTANFNGSVNSFGFLALALLVLGKWKPIGIFLGSIVFAFLVALSNVLGVTSDISKNIPSFIFSALPYFLTVVTLVAFSKSSIAPKFEGIHFRVK